MKNIYLAQFSTISLDRYFYFPYSAGLVWCYASTHEDVAANYSLKSILWKKEEIDVIVDSLDNPAVFGMSLYVWNIYYNIELAKKIKDRYPNCTIVFGGPGVPDKDLSYFKKYPWVDFCVHTEGEIAFTELLQELLKDDPDFSTVSSISYAGPFQTHYTSHKGRIKDLEDIPSPYLTGLFDPIVEEAKEKNLVMNGLLETNRGCPFKCSFCDWGGLTYGKVFRFNLDRVQQEIEWMGRNGVELMGCADANFGIFASRDKQVAQWMIDTKAKYGYPKFFDTSWTKVTKPETLEIARMLMDAGLLRKFTMSVQTLDEQTLKNIKRTNVDGSTFQSLIYDRDISISTELITGLPGETLDSYKRGICKLIEDEIKIVSNPLTLLPNSEMSTPEYRREWKIKGKMIHSSFSSHGVDEWEELCIETASYTQSDWQEMIIWGWLTMFLDTYYWTDLIAKQYDTKLWYDWANQWFRSHETPLSPWLDKWKNHLEDGLSYELWGGGVGTTDLDTNEAMIVCPTWDILLRQCVEEFCETHSLPLPDEAIILQQLNRHQLLPGYDSLSHQLVSTRWNYHSRAA